MKVRFNGSHYVIPLGLGPTDPRLTIHPIEAQELLLCLLQEMGREGDLIPIRKQIIPILEDIYHQT